MKRKDYDYSVEVGLLHNERVAVVDMETGSIHLKPALANNIPEGKELFEPDAFFQKHYPTTWTYLQRQTSSIEFAAAMRLALLAKANTNSLEPLNDATTLASLVEVLGVGINKVNLVLKKLAYLGVYAQFSVVDKEKGYTRYWVLNPYLSFTGQLIDSDLASLFKGTRIAAAFYDPEYGRVPSKKALGLPTKIKKPKKL